MAGISCSFQKMETESFAFHLCATAKFCNILYNWLAGLFPKLGVLVCYELTSSSLREIDIFCNTHCHSQGE